MAKPAWLSVSPKSGTGDQSIQVTAQAHTGRSNRQGTITVSTTGGASAEVECTQTAHEAFVTAGEKQNVGSTKTTATVTFTTNVQAFKLIASAGTTIGTVNANGAAVSASSEVYTPAGDPGASAQYTVTVVITFVANDTLKAITHTVKLQDSATSSVTDTASVTQAEGTTRVTVDPDTLTFAVGGESKRFSVSSNDSWTIS